MIDAPIKLGYNGKVLEQITVLTLKHGRLLSHKGWRDKTYEDEERRLERLAAMKRRLGDADDL